jgi:hypothetical protein
MLVDPLSNRVDAGFRFNLTAEEVIAYCSQPA